MPTNDPRDPLEEGSPAVVIDIDPELALDAFPSETLEALPSDSTLLVFIPAEPPAVSPSAAQRRRRRAATRGHGAALRHYSTVVALKTIAFGQMLGRTAGLAIQLAGGLWFSLCAGVVALWSAVWRFVIGGFHQVRGRLEIDWRRHLALRSAAFISHFRRTVRWSVQLSMQSAGTASRIIRRGAHDIETRSGQFLRRGLRSTQHWMAVQIDRIFHLAGQFNAVSRLLRSTLRTQATHVTGVLNATKLSGQRWRHASRAARHDAFAGLEQAVLSTVQRFGVLAVIITAVIATGIFVSTQWRALGGTTPLAATSLGIVPLAVASIESRPVALKNPRTTRVPATSLQRASPGRTGRRVDAEAIRSIQRVLNRYRDANSTLDVSGVRSIWPSVDTNALRLAFDRLAEYNLDYNACQISLGDARAHAECDGIAQSRRVGERTTRTTNRQWHFVVNRVENRWLIVSVVVR